MRLRSLVVSLSTIAVLAAGSPSCLAADSASPMAPAQAGGPGEVADDYVLGPDDKLRVITYGEETLTGEFMVAADGDVSLPLIGNVHAGGLTLKVFQQHVQDALGQGYLKDPRVSVEVLNYRPYYILGEVNKPGDYPYTQGLTVLNAVATASGFTYRANTHRVYVRGAHDTTEHAAPLTAATKVAPGDTIRIGERFF
ncbi:MAG TPA: polysaccharide biosynthesis/export family protein [Caulobacteraceae bacterium]